MLASAVDMSQNDPTYPGPPVLGISHYGHHFIPRKAFHAATLLGYRRCFIPWCFWNECATSWHVQTKYWRCDEKWTYQLDSCGSLRLEHVVWQTSDRERERQKCIAFHRCEVRDAVWLIWDASSLYKVCLVGIQHLHAWDLEWMHLCRRSSNQW